MYCKHCNEYVSSSATTHNCKKVGLLNIEEDSSFLVSTLIGLATDNSIIGAALGGNIIGGIVGDLLNDGELF